MNQDDIPRSDPYSPTYPNYDHVPIPPPPPGFGVEPTLPSHFAVPPTVKASPPPAPPVPKWPKPPKQIKAFSKRTALIAWGSMFGVICLCALLVLIAVVTRPWTTVREYTGSGGGVTTLTVPNYWRVSWQCSLQEGATTPQPFIIEAYENGQRPTLVSSTCQSARQSGVSAQQTQGGNVILYVTADATSSWTVDIQT